MGFPFRSSSRGLEVRLPADERAMLADLLGQLEELLDDGTPLPEPGADPFDELTRMAAGLGDLTVTPGPDSAGPDAGPDAALHTGPDGGGGARPEAGPGAGPEAGLEDDAADAGSHAASNGATGGDPALARLLPDANRDDPELAAEFRRLTEPGLRTRKRLGAKRAAEALRREAPVLLAEDESQALLKALTDLRLVLGERLDLKTDDDATRLELQLTLGIEPYEGWLPLASTYETLRWLQEGLVQALSTRR